jgi:hypothetical protein
MSLNISRRLRAASKKSEISLSCDAMQEYGRIPYQYDTWQHGNDSRGMIDHDRRLNGNESPSSPTHNSENFDRISPFTGLQSGDPLMAANSPQVRLTRSLPVFTAILVLVTCMVFLFSDVHNCSEPLATWTVCYVFRQIFKTLLYRKATASADSGVPLGSLVVWGIAIADFLGPTVWTLGGYYIFHTQTCDPGLYIYASILWGLHTLSLLLPCFFISVILFCAPCLLWLAPYIVRQNPNTVATSREIRSFTINGINGIILFYMSC